MRTIQVGLVFGWVCLVGCTSDQTVKTAAQGEKTVASAAQAKPTGVHAFTMKSLDGGQANLADYQGNVLLVVNVASKCGYTPQYTGLQKLYADHKDAGLVVLGVPSNDFGKQEPGTEAEIKTFCSTKYQVTFPMLAKVSVKNGEQQCDLYRYLSDQSQNDVLDAEVSWNFNKFLVGKDGRPIKHYPSKIKPDDAALLADIQTALKE